MSHRTYSHPSQILFEDQVILSDGRTKLHPVLLQLTSETLIIRPRNPIPRKVVIQRDLTTGSFGFSIKGGRDTGK